MSRLRFALRLAGRELRAAPLRWALLLAPVAAGVAALVAIESFADSLHASVQTQARTLLGGDLVLRSAAPLSTTARHALDAALSEAGAGTDVERAQVVSFGAMGYVPGGSGARLVVVTAVEGRYPFYGSVTTEPAGGWPPPPDRRDALVDPSLLGLLSARVGDQVALGAARFRIAGTLRGYPGDVGIRAAFGPRVAIHADHLESLGLLGFGSRSRHELFVRLPASVDAGRLAEALRGPLEAQRVSLRTVDDDQQRLDRVLGRLVRYLALVGLIAVLLGGVGVASGIHVFVEQKMETVALLRCLGGTAGQVFSAYLVQVLGLALAGSVVGAAAGVLVGRVLPTVLGPLVPVAVEPVTSWPAIALGIATGAWLALVFALLPLLAVRRVPPLAALRRAFDPPERPPRDRARWAARAALAGSVTLAAVIQSGSWQAGLGFAAAVGASLALLGGVSAAAVSVLRRTRPPRLAYPWRQGLANLHRPANQTRAVVLALGFGTFLLGTLLLVQHNLLADLRLDRGGANLAVFDVQPDQKDALMDDLEAAGARPSVPVPVVPMRLATVAGRPIESLLSETHTAGESADRWAFRREYRSTYRDRLTASERPVVGDPWPPARAEGAQAPVPVSVEQGLARSLEVSVGDTLVWDVQGVSVETRVAQIRDVDWARFEPNFFVVFPEGPLDQAPQTFVTLARVDDAAGRGRLQRGLLERYPNVSVLDLSELRATIESLIAQVSFAVRFLALFSLAAGGLVLLSAVAAGRRQRLREAVLLRTLGATRRQVWRVAVAEYAALGTLAAGTGLLLATVAASAVLRLAFDSGIAVPWLALLGLGGVVVGLTLAIGLANAAEAFRRTPLELLRAE